jgi:predicted ATPase
MFRQLSFQNFKSWEDTGEIKLAPITGFFGTNSSGKSAILQFLLMLKQTILWLHLARIAIMNLQYYSQIILKIDLINNIC